jgi:hypothetical protein
VRAPWQQLSLVTMGNTPSAPADDSSSLSTGCAGARSKMVEVQKQSSKTLSGLLGAAPLNEMTPVSTANFENPKSNILLMTDGYKFSHHKQYPVSWMPEHARPKEGIPPVLYPPVGLVQGARVLKVAPVPGVGILKLTFVTNVSTAVVAIEPVTEDSIEPDFFFSGSPTNYTGLLKNTIVVEISSKLHASLNLPEGYTKFKFANIDESKLKRGSNMNPNYEGGYNGATRRRAADQRRR